MSMSTRRLAVSVLTKCAAGLCALGVAAHCEAQGKSFSPPSDILAAPGPAPTQQDLPLTQLDWAIAQWRLDHWITAHHPTGALAEAVSRKWDHSTKSRQLNIQEMSLMAMNEALVIAQDDAATAAVQRTLLSLRVRMAPLVFALDQPSKVSATLRSLYVVTDAVKGPLSCQFQVVDSRNAPLVDVPFDIQLNNKGLVNQIIAIDLGGKTLSPGSYWVQIQPPTGPAVTVTRWTVVPASLTSVHDKNQALLSLIKQFDSSLVTAMATAQARNEMLSDAPSEDYTTSLLLDLEQLSRDVTQEIIELRAGKNPYIRRLGDTPRVLPWGEFPPRFRIYVPEAASGQSPVPLVIYLNLIGGDENLFLDLYGAGEIRQLADKYGFIVASCHLATFAINPNNISLLVDELVKCYDIDRSRIYLIGHATGAEVINRWLVRQPDMVTAACLISSGAWFTDVKTIPPTLVVAGQADAIVPADEMQQACNKAIADGLPVAFLSYPDCGHSSVIAEALPDILKWLLQQKKTVATK